MSKLLQQKCPIHACQVHRIYLCILRLPTCLQLFSDKRVMHNVRHGWDIAKFLAEPKFEDIAGHHSNLT